jgi:hypothetical protein
LKNPEEIDWSRVQGLDCGLWTFSNQDNHPIIWNEKDKCIDVLENGEPIMSFKKSQVRNVIYK